MPVQFINAAFSTSDGVPGPYGEVAFGAGATSAASIPLKLLCVGLKNSVSGSATADVDVFPIYSTSDADTYFGAGGQLNRQLRGALNIPGVQLFGAAVASSGGATAAAITLTFVAGQSVAGTYTFRIAGKTMQITIGASDSATTVATNFKNTVNSFPELPVKVTNASGVATLTAKSLGTSGNTLLFFQDTTQLPSGCTATVTNAGTQVTGGGYPFSGATIGTGTEDVTNLLAVLFPQHFDRIAVGQVDATNLALWRTQIDAQAGVLNGNLQHVVSATVGTLAAAESLGQTTLNDQRFQHLWYLNSETPSADLAATFAAARTLNEQTDPDSAFDFYTLPGVSVQQKPDWPNHATLVGAINNSVTPVTGTADGHAQVVRSITTRSLNGSTPDYSTHDTGEAVTPDFVLTDLKLLWSTQVAPQNPRVADNPLPGAQPRPAGVIFPDLWASMVLAKLRAYEQGKLGSNTTSPAQVPPIIINVDSFLPSASFDPVAQRIMLAAPVQVAPSNHQVGCSIRQVH